MRFLVFPVLFFLVVPVLNGAEEAKPDLSPLKKWVARQGRMETLSADFVQTRALRVLRDPVARSGRLWFSAQGNFRWEMGRPPEMVALRKGDEVLLISLRGKKALRFSMRNASPGSGLRDLAMMEFPIAADFSEFERRFDVLDLATQGDHCEVTILPKDPRTRKMLRKIRLILDTATGYLQTFEIAFRDGSVLKNEFSNVQVNRGLEPGVFDFDLAGYKVTDEKN